MAKKRVFILGIDGGTLDVIAPLAEKGILPNFKRIIDDGASGTLESTIPPVTAVAWPSIFTGVNPGKHGVSDFISRDEKEAQKPVSAATIRAKSLWRYLSNAGKTCVVIDVPMTFPPEEINGVMVSGFVVPSKELDFVFPKKLKKEVLSVMPDYKLDVMPPDFSIASEKEIDQMVQELHEMLEQQFKLSKKFFDSVNWDFFMITVISTDRAQHAFWKFSDKQHPRYDEKQAQRYKNVITDVYKKVDKFLGETIEKLGEEDLLIIVSDHGFGPQYNLFMINKWLFSEGLSAHNKSKNAFDSPELEYNSGGSAREEDGKFILSTKSKDAYAGIRKKVTGLNAGAKYRVCFEVEGTPETMVEINDFLSDNDNGPIFFLEKVKPGRNSFKTIIVPKKSEMDLSFRLTSYGGNPCGEITVADPSLMSIMDWENSVASPGKGWMSVRINLKGRTSHGSVPKEDYNKICRDISNRLKNVRDEKTGEPLFNDVYLSHEVYSGPLVDNFNDIIPEFNHDKPFSSKFLRVPPHDISGTHRRNGLFMAYGQNCVRKGTVPASVLDITPTVLYFLGLPIPKGMDGKALTNIFAPSLVKARQVVYSEESVWKDKFNPETKDEKNDELVMARLRGLGYVE